MSLKKEIEDFMNSPVTRKGKLRSLSYIDFSAYLADEFVKMVEKRIDNIFKDILMEDIANEQTSEEYQKISYDIRFRLWEKVEEVLK
jgi:hypothetical protein